MRYVVTGAAGFIGSHLSEALSARGDDVVGVDCFTDYYDPALKEENARGREVLRLDLAEDELDFAGLDGVFHLAGQPGVRSFGEAFPLYLRRNVLATQRVFQSAAEADVRVVFSSSSSVYGEAERYPTPEDTVPHPISPYGVTKLACEHLAAAYATAFSLHAVSLRYFTVYGEAERYPTPEDTVPHPISPYGVTKLACEHLAAAYATAFSLHAVSLRYFTVYGPRQRPDMFFRRVCDVLLRGGTFEIYGSGEQSRSFTEVSDVVSGTIAAMNGGEPGAVYNVGGGEEASMLEAIAALERISGRTLDVRRVDPARGDVRRTKADVSRIRDALGWHPRVGLEDGLERMWAWASARVAAA